MHGLNKFRMRRKATIWSVLAASFLAACVSVGPARAQAPGRGRVYIILWFITDDSQLAQDDTAAKRLAAYLTQQGVRATFLVSAEKARAIERRNRQDVIGALAQHEIGYYLEHPGQGGLDANAGTGRNLERQVRSERTGLADVRRVLGQSPTCYDGAEAILTPALYATLQKWGMKVRFHRGRWPAAYEKPFWHEGLLNIYTSRETQQLRPDSNWSNLAEARARFQDFRFRVSSRREGTLLNVCFRPAEFVQQADPAKEEGARASGGRDSTESPAVKSPEESEKAFSYFESLVTYLKSSSGVEFVTASAALGMLRDTAQRRVFSRAEIGDIAKFVEPEISFQDHEDYILAPSEVLYLLAKSIAVIIRRQPYEPILLDGTPSGPDSSPPESGPPLLEVPWDQFATAALEVAGYVSKQDQVPDAVRVGNSTVSPARFLRALAQVTQTLQLKGEFPESVQFGAARLSVGDYLEGESSAPLGESATGQDPLQRGLAKLQAWTFKPARFQTQR